MSKVENVEPLLKDHKLSAFRNPDCLRNFVNNPLLSDITFRVGSSGAIIYGHAFPLVTASTVFYRMITKLLKDPEEDVVVPDIEPATFVEMLKFAYYGEPTLSAQNLVSVYYAAEKYELLGLLERCLRYIKKEESAVLKIYMTTNVPYKVEEACLAIICRNPFVLFRSPDFVNLFLEKLETICSCSELRCNEDQLIAAVKTWLNHKSEALQRGTFEKLLNIVRNRKQRWEDYHCKKRTAFGQMSYTTNRCEDIFLLTARKDLLLFGVGMYIGCKDSKLPMLISVDLMSNEEYIRNCQAYVTPKEDVFIYDLMFEKLTLKEGSQVTVICKGPQTDDTKLAKFALFNQTLDWTGDSSVLKLESSELGHTAIASIYFQDVADEILI
ncbi:BTB/POZ domain-containing protein 19-like [Uranotaenia lowii]|uniref:BTB/POZ domain-containing protein 19-like n=1 Tax=Uranotaenia lowii TaxID=190385 RepID=UPI0024799DFF|nr:BTB/POZ domain-containing protein 19-like [Uranotaenia lowii]